MKQFSRIVAVAILMSLWIPLAGGLGEERLGTPPRVEVSLVLLEAPSTVEISTDLSSVGTMIVHQSQLTPGSTVYLEAWCQTPSPNGISTAVLDLEYDTPFLDTSLAQVVLAPQWGLLPFDVFIDDVVGLVDDLGGNNLSGLGSAPNWAKVGTIEFDVTSAPSDAVLFCSWFAEGPLKFAIRAEGLVDPDDVSYGCFLAGCSSAVDCNDGNPCTDDSCDATLGCVNVNNTAPCDDGEICTNNDTCADGVCLGSSPPDCDDGNVCTTDSCDLALGCINALVDDETPCPDDVFCNGEEICQGGVCTDESDPCLDLAHCDEGIDSCLECVNAEECDDGNPCALGVCVFGGTCTFLNNDGPCSDNDACTQTDTCQAGVCSGSNPVVCTALDQCHNPGTCDPSTGACSDPAKPEDTTCDDDDACTQTDTCAGGICVGGPPLVCDNGLFCDGEEPCDIVLGCQPGAYSCTDPFLPQCDEENDACVVCLILGDATGNAVVDLEDFGVFPTCMTSPVGPIDPAVFAAPCGCFDMDIDGDVDLRDFRIFQLAFNGAE